MSVPSKLYDRACELNQYAQLLFIFPQLAKDPRASYLEELFKNHPTNQLFFSAILAFSLKIQNFISKNILYNEITRLIETKSTINVRSFYNEP
jgi:hypothetical protein